MKPYKVTEECISCHACVEVTDKNFKMGEELAYVYKQPKAVNLSFEMMRQPTDRI